MATLLCTAALALSGCEWATVSAGDGYWLVELKSGYNAQVIIHAASCGNAADHKRAFCALDLIRLTCAQQPLRDFPRDLCFLATDYSNWDSMQTAVNRSIDSGGSSCVSLYMVDSPFSVRWFADMICPQ